MENKFRTLELAVEFFQACQGIKLNGAFKNQFERALLSIPLNLSEGSAKPSAKERRKFYFISLGSFRECQMILKLSGQKRLLTLSDKLGAHLYCLCRKT